MLLKLGKRALASEKLESLKEEKNAVKCILVTERSS
jgi:hypothetical protein